MELVTNGLSDMVVWLYTTKTYAQIIDFIVRRCSTDHKVFRQSYIIHTTTALVFWIYAF